MSIRRKTLLATLFAVLGAGIAVFAASRCILARGFASIEQESVGQAVERVRLAIAHELDILATTTGDWANWDDTYQFVQDRNARYVKSNLSDTSIANVNADLVLYFGRDGKTVYARRLNAAPDAGVDGSYQNEVVQVRALLDKCLRGSAISGLVASPDGLVLVAARPILTSEQTGPPMGMLVMGRHVSSAEVAELARLTLTRLALRKTRDSHLPEDFAGALNSLKGGNQPAPLVSPLSADRVAGYSVLRDIHGLPAAIIRADIPRDVHQQGDRAMLYFSLALVISMAAFGVAINWLLERLVTSRLSSLTATIRDIAASSDTSERVVVEGRDELAGLATTLNLMLAAIERSEDALRENEARLRTVLDSVQTGIMIVDAETHEVVEVNETALEMSGNTREQLVGNLCHKYICPAEQGKCPITDLGQNIDSSERILLTRDGRDVPVIKRAVAISLGGRACILESFLDITDRKRSEEAFRFQAYHDGLTGLPNRQRFQEGLTEAIAHAAGNDSKVAVLLLDLDRFKTINDTLGHSAGDKLLQAVAGRLTACLRTSDAVARLGGDEFALLLTDIQDVESTASLARRLREGLKPPFWVDGVDLHATASIGISVFPRDGATVEQLLQRADVALYHAKDQGRDTYRHYASWIDASARARLTLENDLRRALDRGEFVLHYQPQVRIPSVQVVGLEALLRWQHPEMGLLMPGEFLPLAEETGLMQPIGEWVVGEACRQSRLWQDAGLQPVKIAVNLAASQFRQQRLTRVVERALKDTGLSPDLLELEITETAVMMNIGMAAELMARLKAVGVRLCLDDFGVGNTSLVRLKQFPIDTVKVDGSFLRTVETNPTDAAIVSAIIGIGESLGLLVIGEGVETPGQMRFLRERGCETMQGFLFSQPVSPPEVARMLRESSLRAETIPLA